MKESRYGDKQPNFLLPRIKGHKLAEPGMLPEIQFS